MFSRLIAASIMSLAIAGSAVAQTSNTTGSMAMPTTWAGAISDAFFSDAEKMTMRDETEVKKRYTALTVEQKATVKAKATPASAKKGAVVTVKGKVTNEFVKTGGPEATGKVIIKDGKKTVGTGKLKKGKFTVKLNGLAVGSHTLTVLYKGDSYTDKGVSKELKVTVKA